MNIVVYDDDASFHNRLATPRTSWESNCAMQQMCPLIRPTSQNCHVKFAVQQAIHVALACRTLVSYLCLESQCRRFSDYKKLGFKKLQFYYHRCTADMFRYLYVITLKTTDSVITCNDACMTKDSKTAIVCKS